MLEMSSVAPVDFLRMDANIHLDSAGDPVIPFEVGKNLLLQDLLKEGRPGFPIMVHGASSQGDVEVMLNEGLICKSRYAVIKPNMFWNFTGGPQLIVATPYTWTQENNYGAFEHDEFFEISDPLIRISASEAMDICPNGLAYLQEHQDRENNEYRYIPPHHILAVLPQEGKRGDSFRQADNALNQFILGEISEAEVAQAFSKSLSNFVTMNTSELSSKELCFRLGAAATEVSLLKALSEAQKTLFLDSRGREYLRQANRFQASFPFTQELLKEFRGD